MDYLGPSGNNISKSRSSRRLLIVVVTLATSLLYCSLPILAGIFSIGDRHGPVIYPQTAHEVLYIVGWELAGHSGKPRVLGRGAPPRPLFYGL